MPGSAKTLSACAMGGLVLVTAYTVALGSNGWLWFGWVVLTLATVGVLLTSGSRPGR
ncbi:hypothetical protein SRB5_08080 [Streptomyces sp. RB5]|uniref:Integral membrane protein n=1 Tax=Streptomyces smaragdinus TaxID=2585196 RepID=A0A7K0CB80_9ACTN|nr:hypothetical protein [Streptomyces smaragdinus]MQY10695.1 hypothetical protein [Streptomyces smaragdinus]